MRLRRSVWVRSSRLGRQLVAFFFPQSFLSFFAVFPPLPSVAVCVVWFLSQPRPGKEGDRANRTRGNNA